jgi:hypothetical protein
MSFVEVLRRVAANLDQSEIHYMVTGSIAAAYYGLPSDEYYAPLQDALDAHRHQSMFNVLDMTTGWKN